MLPPSSCWADTLKSNGTLGLLASGKTSDRATAVTSLHLQPQGCRAKLYRPCPGAEAALEEGASGRRRETGEGQVGLAITFSPVLQAHQEATFLSSQEPRVKTFDQPHGQVREHEESSPPPTPPVLPLRCPRRPTVFWAVSPTFTLHIPFVPPTLTESQCPCSQPQRSAPASFDQNVLTTFLLPTPWTHGGNSR